MREEEKALAAREQLHAFAQLTEQVPELLGAMRTFAGAIGQLEAEVRGLKEQLRGATPISWGQEKELNALIRTRGEELARVHRFGDEVTGGRSIAQAIRQEIRRAHGVRAMRELRACEYGVLTERVRLWEDYRRIKEIKGRVDR